MKQNLMLWLHTKTDNHCTSCQQAREHLLKGIITVFTIVGSIAYIRRGSHFDPDVVDALVQRQQEFLRIADKFADSEDERKALRG